MFSTLLSSITIVAIVMGVGFYLQRKGYINDSTRSNLTEILLRVTMPCTFFMSMQVNFEHSLYKNAILMLITSFLMHGLFILIGYMTCFIFKVSEFDKGVVIFAITFANLTFVGFPILRTVFANSAQDPIFYASVYVVPFNLLAFTFGTNILSTGEQKPKFNFKELIKPVNVALVLGFICFSFNIIIPKVIGDALNLIGQMSIPLSLMITGAIIGKSNLKTMFSEPKLIYINFVRLIVCPIVFYLLLMQFNLDEYTFKISIILSMLPSGAYTAILAEKYGGNKDLAAKIVFSSTILSLGSIILLSFFLL